MSRILLHHKKLALFALLSLVDLLLTCHLLSTQPGRVHEGNPVARWWFLNFGPLGLVLFKFLCVAAVVGLALSISRRSLRTGGRLLGFGCVAVGLIVVYSTALVIAAPPQGPDPADLLLAEQSRNENLDQEWAKCQAYHDLLERLVTDLLARRSPLARAAEVLAESEKGRDPRWRQTLQRCYPGLSARACLAANLLNTAVCAMKDLSPSQRQVLGELKKEFHELFGRPVPLVVTVAAEPD